MEAHLREVLLEEPTEMTVYCRIKNDPPVWGIAWDGGEVWAADVLILKPSRTVYHKGEENTYRIATRGRLAQIGERSRRPVCEIY